MIGQRPAQLTALFAAAMLVFAADASAAPGEGHGGGAGHALAGRRGGWPGGYRAGFRGYYGYPGWYGVGVGLGLGIGYGLGYGYGYPYYPYGYPYPVYVDPISGPPPNAPVQAGSLVPVGAREAVPVPPGAPAGPVRLTDTDVLFSIRVPADAIVRINGEQTTQGGPRREFATSGLLPGRTYTFSISARWTGPNGEPVEIDRRIAVQGGERRTVDFLMPAPKE